MFVKMIILYTSVLLYFGMYSSVWVYRFHTVIIQCELSWGNICRATAVLGRPGDTKHSKCLLLGGRQLNQLTLIPKPKESGGARAAMAQVGPANKRNDTKRCLPVEASLRPEEAVPWSTTECPAVPNTSVQSCCQTSSAPR